MNRDFRLFWLGQTTSRLGSSVSSVAIPLVAVSTLEASAFEVALLTAFAWLPWLFLGLPAGAWVDRLSRRSLMICCDLICLGLFGSVPVAWWLGVLTVGQLMVVQLLAGAASVFLQTAYQVYVPTLLPDDQVPAGNARLQSTEAGANVAGPGLAGLIAGAANAAVAVLIDAASFLVSAICLLRIRVREDIRRPTERTPLRQEILAGIRFVARDPYLRVLTVGGAVSNIALLGYQAVLVVFLIREVGVAPATVGVLTAGMSVGGVIGAALATRLSRRFGSARGFVLAQVVASPFGLLLAWAAPGVRLPLAVLGGAIMVAGIAAGNVIKGSFRQTYTPRQLLGRVTVSMQLLNYGTIPVGAVLGGVLGTTIGLRPTMVVMLAGVALAGWIPLISPIRHRRDLPLTPTPSATMETTIALT